MSISLYFYNYKYSVQEKLLKGEKQSLIFFQIFYLIQKALKINKNKDTRIKMTATRHNKKSCMNVYKVMENMPHVHV